MENVDRFAILITSGAAEELVGVPFLQRLMDKGHSFGVYESLTDWNLDNKIICLCYDTISESYGMDGRSFIKLNSN